MKITFIGLSCFMIENAAGYRILVDPFDDSPEWALGPKFPTNFDGQPFGTNLLLISETDADHARKPAGWQQNAPPVKVHSNPFPNLNLHGTLVYEFNGEPCIAWQYTIDDIRLAHFSDNAHRLTTEQLQEIGKPDVVFYPIPKVKWEQQEYIEVARDNIAKLNPKLVIWAHHIVPENMPPFTETQKLREFFMSYFKQYAATSKLYKNETSFIELCYMLESAYRLTEEYHGSMLPHASYEITKEKLAAIEKTKALLFIHMLAKSD